MDTIDEHQGREMQNSSADNEDDDSGILFVPFEPAAEVERSRRNLPHWQQAGVAYFVTFRLADSLPNAKLYQWIEERTAWLHKNPEPWNTAQWKEHNRLFPARMERWLDAGEGQCILTHHAASQIVEGALHFFDRQRYVMDAYSIMPNHVHVLVSPKNGFSLS